MQIIEQRCLLFIVIFKSQSVGIAFRSDYAEDARHACRKVTFLFGYFRQWYYQSVDHKTYIRKWFALNINLQKIVFFPQIT